tara:strand:- start:277 stop:648 length:372 start_codon:yes stop_codon:yes gene_type:complete
VLQTLKAKLDKNFMDFGETRWRYFFLWPKPYHYVVKTVKMGKQIVRLKNSGHGSLPWWQRAQVITIPAKAPPSWSLKASNQFKQRCLADPRRALNRQNFTAGNAEIIGEIQFFAPAEPKSFNP